MNETQFFQAPKAGLPPRMPAENFFDMEDPIQPEVATENIQSLANTIVEQTVDDDFCFRENVIRKFGVAKAIEIIEAIFSNTDISKEQQYNVIYEMSEDIFEYGAFSSDYADFFSSFIRKLELIDPSAQTETRNLLEILRPMIHVIHTYSYEEGCAGKTNVFVKQLQELAGKKQNNYFLNLRLDQILKTNMDFSLGGSFSTDNDIFPFRISPQHFGLPRDGKLLVTDADNYGKAYACFEKIDAYRKYKEAELEYLDETLFAIDEYFESLSEEDLDEYNLDDYTPYDTTYSRTSFDESILTRGTVFEDLRKVASQKENVSNLFAKYPEVENAILEKIKSFREAFLQSENALIESVGITNASWDDDAFSAENRFHIANYEETMLEFFRPVNPSEIALSQTHSLTDSAIQLSDYTYLLSKPIRSLVEKEFGLKIEQLSIIEQGYFLNFLKNKNVEEVDMVKNFLNKSDNGVKINKVKTFLSLEHGGKDLGEKILAIGERLDQASAEAIFAKYAELADAAQNAGQYLAEQFGQEQSQYAQEVTEHLLHRGKALLILFADEQSITPEQITAKLASIQAEMEIFRESFKTVKSNKSEFSLEDIKATKFKILQGLELYNQKEIVAKMEEIYLENYAGFPQEFQQKILASLEQRLTDSSATFYTLYHQNEIIAFCSFLPREDGTIHFANFNVSQKYNFSKIGESMMEASLDQEAKKAPIIAEAVPNLPITNTYLAKKDFIKTGDINVAGVDLWQIRREKTN